MFAPLTRLVLPATVLPVPLADALVHLKAQGCPADEQTYITGLLKTVADAFTRESKQALMQATYASAYPNFWHGGVLSDLRGPVLAVESLTYRAADGTTVTVAATDYALSIYDPGTLTLKPTYETTLPRALYRPGAVDAVQVRYRAGYATAADVPVEIRAWVLLTLGHWYENRQSVAVGLNVSEVPHTARQLMNLIREPSL